MSKISIIVPVYNTGEYLRPCLDSIAAQTTPDYEVLLVDDGSTDGSDAVCRDYAEKNPRFRYFYQENGGVSAARAEGLTHAEGDFICFWDSDDLMHPALARTLLEAIEAAGADIACCRVAPFTQSPPANGDCTGTQLWSHDEALDHLLHDKAIDWGLYNRLFRRSLLTPAMVNNGFRFNEDLLCNWDAFRSGSTVVFCSFTGYYYRQRAGSSTRNGLEISFIAQQWQVAGRILHSAQGTPLQQSAEAFYYEKMLYLYSMILRQKTVGDFVPLAGAILGEIKRRYKTAMALPQLPAKMKLVATLSRLPVPYYRVFCRLFLKDRC